jgi:uncharacterized protein YcaQ
MKKTPKRITKKEKRPTTVATWWDEYKDMFDLRMKPVNDAFLDRVAADMIEYFKKDATALCMDDFYDFKGFHDRDVQRWKQRSENLRDAADYCKRLLANRREKGALNKKLSESMVLYSMGIYSNQWKEHAEWKASLAQKNQQQQGTVHIHMDAIPNSDLVPERKKK